MKKRDSISYYDSQAKEISGQYERLEMSFLMDVLIKHFRNAKRVLEIGSGSGRDAAYLMREGFVITGLEGSVAMIREAEKLHPELKGRILYAVLPDEWPRFEQPFEAMFSIATLMHFPKEGIEKILRQCRNVLLPDSPVFISVSGKREEKGTGRYFNEMGKDEWENVFRGTGYEIISVEENNDVTGRKIRWYTFLLRTMEP